MYLGDFDRSDLGERLLGLLCPLGDRLPPGELSLRGDRIDDLCGDLPGDLLGLLDRRSPLGEGVRRLSLFRDGDLLGELRYFLSIGEGDLLRCSGVFASIGCPVPRPSLRSLGDLRCPPGLRLPIRRGVDLNGAIGEGDLGCPSRK
eukprot:2341357-Amphidinium_carterae.1